MLTASVLVVLVVVVIEMARCHMNESLSKAYYVVVVLLSLRGVATPCCGVVVKSIMSSFPFLCYHASVLLYVIDQANCIIVDYASLLASAAVSDGANRGGFVKSPGRCRNTAVLAGLSSVVPAART